LAAFPRFFPAGAAKELIGRGQILQHQPLCGRIDGRGKDLPGIQWARGQQGAARASDPVGQHLTTQVTPCNSMYMPHKCVI